MKMESSKILIRVEYKYCNDQSRILLVSSGTSALMCGDSV